MKTYFLKLLILALALLFCQTTWARCVSSSSLNAGDNNSAKIPAGKLNLPNKNFLPDGSLIKSVVVPPTNYTFRNSNASTVLWTCDTTDLSSIYFLVATNGDDRVGGYWEVGKSLGFHDVYATDLQYVGMKVMFGNLTVSRYYQKLPITTYERNGSKIYIRLADLPTAVVELYRVPDLPPKNGAASNYCPNDTKPSSQGSMQLCNQPNFYIQLVGNGLIHDNVGEDAASNFRFWGANNGFGYGMKLLASVYKVETCAATSATPYVMFPSITSAELNNGQTVSQPFNISLNCDTAATSGISNGQTALGLQVSAGAYKTAKVLGLTNNSGGVTILLSDNYYGSNIAKGVGIDIAYADAPTEPMTLFGGQSFIDPFNSNYMGKRAGWYPVLYHAIQTGSGTTNNTYVTNFIATLKKINGFTVSAGKVHSTVTVVVRMQ